MSRFLDDLATPHSRYYDSLPLLKEIYVLSGLTLTRSPLIADGTRAVFLDIQIPHVQCYSLELDEMPGLHFGLYARRLLRTVIDTQRDRHRTCQKDHRL
jgi:hypothetical protein